MILKSRSELIQGSKGIVRLLDRLLSIEACTRFQALSFKPTEKACCVVFMFCNGHLIRNPSYRDNASNTTAYSFLRCSFYRTEHWCRSSDSKSEQVPRGQKAALDNMICQTLTHAT